MRTFRMDRLPEEASRVDRLVEAMDRFDLKPDYQRQSDLWSVDKKQLFIDSLINGYDVPKLYFHRLAKRTGSAPLFAIVDGKQRLETIREFMKDELALGDDFSDAQADTAPSEAAGKRYKELTLEHPALAGRLAQYPLDIVVIETDDDEIIEELFSRLNEALPLNAPEKRNALGGAMPPIIRRLVRQHVFFTDRLPIENRRYKHYDLVTKFLYLTQRQVFASTKKNALDEFVKSFRTPGGKPVKAGNARALAARVAATLDQMASVFIGQDELLQSIGLVTVYFMAFQKAQTNKKLAGRLTRPRLLGFDQVRQHNRSISRQEQQAIAQGRSIARSRVRRDLATFDRLMQSPNDGMALEYRYRILRSFLEDQEFKDSLPKELRQRIGDA